MLSYSYFDEMVLGILGMIRLCYGIETKTEQDVMKLSAFLTEQHISLVCIVKWKLNIITEKRTLLHKKLKGY